MGDVIATALGGERSQIIESVDRRQVPCYRSYGCTDLRCADVDF